MLTDIESWTPLRSQSPTSPGLPLRAGVGSWGTLRVHRPPSVEKDRLKRYREQEFGDEVPPVSLNGHQEPPQ